MLTDEPKLTGHVPVGFHCVQVQCPRCHELLDLTLPGKHFRSWEEAQAGKVVRCDDTVTGCGLEYFARPILQVTP